MRVCAVEERQEEGRLHGGGGGGHRFLAIFCVADHDAVVYPQHDKHHCCQRFNERIYIFSLRKF